jgi:hypothetical protein
VHWGRVARFGENDRGIQDMALVSDSTILTCDMSGDVRVFRVAD